MRKHDYKKLKVWQKAMDLVDAVYRVIINLPNEEKFALCDQLRRAVVSIPSCIAEGCGRQTEKDFAHYLSMSRGSAYEVETQLLISLRLHYINDEDLKESQMLLDEVIPMLHALIDKYKS